jgi:kynurenine formamidase
MSDTVIDLSQVIETGMQLFPLHSPTHVIPWASREQHGWATNALFVNEHAGTHLDAPFHFLEEGRTVDEINLARLSGPAIVADVSHRWPKGHITSSDLEEATAALPIEDGDAVLLWTGADRHLGEPAYQTDYPGLTQGAATLLADRGARLVGTDAPSIDHPEAERFPVHHTLLPRNVLVVENLASLSRLIARADGRRFTLHTFPLRIRGGTGSPIRAVAVLDDR